MSNTIGTKPRRIGDIGHEWGVLLVQERDGKFYWSIEANTFTYWQEIPFTLYTALIKFEDENK